MPFDPEGFAKILRSASHICSDLGMRVQEELSTTDELGLIDWLERNVRQLKRQAENSEVSGLKEFIERLHEPTANLAVYFRSSTRNTDIRKILDAVKEFNDINRLVRSCLGTKS